MSTGTTSSLSQQEREFIDSFVKGPLFKKSQKNKLAEAYLECLSLVKSLKAAIEQAISLSLKNAQGSVPTVTEGHSTIITLRGAVTRAEELINNGKFKDAGKLLQKSISMAQNLVSEESKKVSKLQVTPEAAKSECERLKTEIERLQDEINGAYDSTKERDEALQISKRTSLWERIDSELNEGKRHFEAKTPNYLQAHNHYQIAYALAKDCWNATVGVQKGQTSVVKGVDSTASGREALLATVAVSEAVPEEKRESMTKFVAARLAASAELDKLALVSAGEHLRLRKLWQAAIDAVNNKKSTLEEGETALKQIADDAEQARLSQEKAIQKEQDILLNKYQELELLNNQIQDDKHVPKELKNEYSLRMAAAKEFTTCTNLDGLKAASPVFTDLKKSLQATANNLDKCKVLANYLKNTVSELVNSKTMAKVLPSASEAHKKAFEALQAEVAKIDPDSGLKKAQAFYKTVDDDRTLAVQIDNWRSSKSKPGVKYEENRLKERFKELDEHLKKITNGVEKKYDGKLLKDLDDAVAAAQSENRNAIEEFDKAIAEIDARLTQYLGQEDDGRIWSPTELSELKQELYGKDAKNHSNQEAVEYHRQLKAAQYNAEMLGDMNQTRHEEALLEARRKEWEDVIWKAWENDFKRVESLVKSQDGDKAELDKIEQLAKGAKKMVNKKSTNQQLDAADSQLSLAKRQLLVLEEEPQGAKSTSKKKVGEIAAKWNRHVAKLKSSDIPALIDAIKKRVRESEAEDLEAAKKKAKEEGSKTVPTIQPMDLSMLDTLLPKAADAFKPGVFDAHVKALVDSRNEKHPDLNKLKASREKALAHVRQFQSYLNGDPLVKHIVMNPFHGGVFTHIYHSLMDLELNLLRCL